MAQIKYRADLYKYSEGNNFQGKPTEEIFTQIMQGRMWEGTESISGIGSSISHTQELLEQIPAVFKKYNIQKLLDAPCGDFNWMQNIDLSQLEYTGGDVVKEIIENNNEKYAADNTTFIQMDLIENIPNGYDMLFCRDCLVHLSFSDIFRILDNLKNSGITFFMTTTFPQEAENKDILTGGWRPLNFLKPPFNFPEPVFLLNEKCSEMNGAFHDKSMGLWRVDLLE